MGQGTGLRAKLVLLYTAPCTDTQGQAHWHYCNTQYLGE